MLHVSFPPFCTFNIATSELFLATPKILSMTLNKMLAIAKTLLLAAMVLHLQPSSLAVH